MRYVFNHLLGVAMSWEEWVEWQKVGMSHEEWAEWQKKFCSQSWVTEADPVNVLGMSYEEWMKWQKNFRSCPTPSTEGVTATKYPELCLLCGSPCYNMLHRSYCSNKECQNWDGEG